MAEIGLRLIGFSHPVFYVVDPLRGFSLVPGAQGWWRDEGESYVRINSQRLRAREHTQTKPPNTIRIAVLGDSFTEAPQVPEQEAFWAVLERELTERGCYEGKSVEVINFGVSGYGTAQQLLTLRHHVWPYEPDLVLLAFFIGNDVHNNLYALEENPEFPYFVYDGDRLVLADGFPAGRWYYPRLLVGYGSKYLRLCQLARMLKVRLQSMRGETASSEFWLADEEAGLDSATYQTPNQREWQDAWRVTEGLLRTMRDETMSSGADFVLATFSSAISVHPDPNVRKRYLERVGIQDFLYPTRRLEELAAAEHIPIVSLTPQLQAYAKQNQVFLHGFDNKTLGKGHWNAEGHRLTGELIARQICVHQIEKRAAAS
jgi:hypothetical protein